MCAFRVSKDKKISGDKEFDSLRLKTHCYNGHRPDKLYGYDIDSSNYDLLRTIVKRDILEKIESGKTRFLTGGALGFDTIAFEEIENIKEEYCDIENILIVPFKNQPNNWYDISKIKYKQMLLLADEVIMVDEQEGYTTSDYEIGEYDADKMRMRSRYLTDFSSSMTSLWNFIIDSSGTYQTIQEANRKSLNQTFINSNTLDVSYNLELFGFIDSGDWA